MSVLVLLSVLGVVLLYLGLFNNAAWWPRWASVACSPPSSSSPLTTISKARSSPVWCSSTTTRAPSLVTVTVLLFLFGIDYYAKVKENVAEQYALMVFSLVGGLLICSFTNLVVLFLGIEILSIPLYILAGGKRDSFRSGEAAFKYFLQGSFASAFLLMGLALIYGATASFDLAAVEAYGAVPANVANMISPARPLSLTPSGSPRWPLSPSTSGARTFTKVPPPSRPL